MKKVAIAEFRKAITDLLLKQGHTSSHSGIITDVLMFAELRGNNQGIVKLVKGALKPNPLSTELRVIFQTPVSGKIDGGQNIGMVVMSESVDLAITKAKQSGVGIVGCSNYSSATGALGVWAEKIAKQDCIAIVMSQCPEMVAPHGSYEAIFGTNPFAIGIPTKPRPQVLDMATSAIAYYGIVTANENGEEIPDNVAYDANGHPTTNPAAALKGAIRVFDRSYKGSHIALMVELLAGALTGAAMEDKAASNNWGSLVLAIDPAIFGPQTPEEFATSAQVMCDRVKAAKPLPGEEGQQQYLPGERGDALAQRNLEAGYLSVNELLYNELCSQLHSTA